MIKYKKTCGLNHVDLSTEQLKTPGAIMTKPVKWIKPQYVVDYEREMEEQGLLEELEVKV